MASTFPDTSALNAGQAIGGSFSTAYAVTFTPEEKLLSGKEVQALLGMGKPGLYKLMNDEPSFPRPIRIGKRRVAWVFSDIKTYLDSRIAERNSKYGYKPLDSKGGSS